MVNTQSRYPATITKATLATMAARHQLPFCAHFKFSQQVVALFNMQEHPPCPAASIVLDHQQGLFMVPQSTRQLLNDFSHQSIFDFYQTRLLVRQSLHPRFVPLILGRAAYLPLAAIGHGSTDWLGLHWLLDCCQDQGAQLVRFTTIEETILQFDYGAGHDLENHINWTSYYSEYLCKVLQLTAQEAGLKIQSTPALGLMQQFSQCQCSLHRHLPQTSREVREFGQLFQDWTLQQIYDFPELQLPKKLQDQTLKIWRYALSRPHSLW
ncbi:hypothetical protein EQ500_01275 [Lactobacillus sp. XV13L]|nr:hypothetical protein [Lactobacillus sp. XV13L]